MTKRMKIILCAVLSFMLCFMAAGYAAVSDPFVLMGHANVEVPSGLFIIDVQPKANTTSGLYTNTVSVPSYSTSLDCTLSKASDRTAGKVTYMITVLNNTKLTYAYRGLYYQSALDRYDNNYVSTTNSNTKIGVVTSFPNGKTVDPGQTLTFEVTYTIGSNRNTFPARTEYRTLLNYQFGINVDSVESAREVVNDKFLNILNTTSTYKTLVDVLDNKFDGSQEWTSNYIGNVGNATADDAVAVNTLFAGQLQMIIDGAVQPATVIIKHENVDNNTMTGDDYEAVNQNNGGVFRGYGCEMTMYLTTDSLSTANGWAPVYVSVFTCDRDADGNISGGWYRIGDVYEGRAPIVGYNGEAGRTGSFVTDNWVAEAATYQVTNSYSYYVADGTTVKTLTQAKDEAMIAEFQDLLTRAKAMMDDMTYAGTGITVVEEAYMETARFYTLDEAGNPVANPDTTRARLAAMVAEMDHALTVAQEAIDRIESGQT